MKTDKTERFTRHWSRRSHRVLFSCDFRRRFFKSKHVGAICMKSKQVGRHFCSYFHGVCPDFQKFFKGFHKFCPDLHWFCPHFQAFCPDFHQIRTFWGGLAPPAIQPPSPLAKRHKN